MTVPPLTDWGFFHLLECIDDAAKGSVVDGELRWSRQRRGKLVVLARGRLEAMFAWRAEEPFTWERADLARAVPPTRDATDAGDLAWSAAAHLGAFAVYRDEDQWKQRLEAARYHALFDFETLALDAPAKREPRVRKHIGWKLAQLADRLESGFVRHGSAGGHEYARWVADCGALVAALGAHVARDLPVRTEIEALEATVGEWAIRAAIPLDEALRVSIDVRGEAKRWGVARGKK